MSIVTCAVDESCFERDFVSTTVCMAGQFGGHTVIETLTATNCSARRGA